MFKIMQHLLRLSKLLQSDQKKLDNYSFCFLQYYSENGLPSKRLMPNICAVCGQELTLTAMEDMDDNAERTYKLSCGHLYLFFTAKVIYYNIVIFVNYIFLYMMYSFSQETILISLLRVCLSVDLVQQCKSYFIGSSSSSSSLDLRSIFYFLSMFLSYTLYICVNLTV